MNTWSTFDAKTPPHPGRPIMVDRSSHNLLRLGIALRWYRLAFVVVLAGMVVVGKSWSFVLSPYGLNLALLAVLEVGTLTLFYRIPRIQPKAQVRYLYAVLLLHGAYFLYLSILFYVERAGALSSLLYFAVPVTALAALVFARQSRHSETADMAAGLTLVGCVLLLMFLAAISPPGAVWYVITKGDWPGIASHSSQVLAYGSGILISGYLLVRGTGGAQGTASR